MVIASAPAPSGTPDQAKRNRCLSAIIPFTFTLEIIEQHAVTDGGACQYKSGRVGHGLVAAPGLIVGWWSGTAIGGGLAATAGAQHRSQHKRTE
jgi:hypothetical protein